MEKIKETMKENGNLNIDARNDNDEWFTRQVEEGLAQIERGEVIPHDEVAARMEKLIAEKRRPI